MEKNKKNAIINYLNEKNLNDNINEIEKNSEDDNIKKVIVNEREGLIERIDKIYVTQDGKLLLREWY